MKSKVMRYGSKNRQGGFSILGVILIVVAIVGVLGVWAMSGQTNTSNSASSSQDVMGASIANDGSALKTAFDTLLINGNAATSITFVPGASSVTNMLDPTNGIQKPTPNANAVGNTTYPQGQWTYQTGVKVMGIGTSATADIVAVLPDIKDGVCQQINTRLYGSAAIPVSGVAESAFTTGGTAAAPTSANAVDMSAVAGVNGWSSGCVSATGGTAGASNVYFRVLKAL